MLLTQVFHTEANLAPLRANLFELRDFCCLQRQQCAAQIDLYAICCEMADWPSRARVLRREKSQMQSSLLRAREYHFFSSFLYDASQANLRLLSNT